MQTLREEMDVYSEENPVLWDVIIHHSHDPTKFAKVYEQVDSIRHFKGSFNRWKSQVPSEVWTEVYAHRSDFDPPDVSNVCTCEARSSMSTEDFESIARSMLPTVHHVVACDGANTSTTNPLVASRS